MDIIRVLRVIEYVGPRDGVELQIEKSIQGTKTISSAGPTKGIIAIRTATIGTYPEILEQGEEDKK